MKIIVIFFVVIISCSHDVMIIIIDTGIETKIETEIGQATIIETETETEIKAEIETEIGQATIIETETETEIKAEIDTSDTEAIIDSYDYEATTACGQYTTNEKDCVTSCEYDAHRLKQDWYYDNLGILVECDTLIHCNYTSNGTNWHCTCWILCNDV